MARLGQPPVAAPPGQAITMMKNFLRKHLKLIILLLLIGLILLLNHLYGWSDLFSEADGLNDFLQQAADSQGAMIGLYLVITIAGCVVLAVPGVTFAVLAGALFGPFLGSLLCLIATTIGAMGSYLVGRFFLRDSIKPLAMKNKYLCRWLFEETEKSDILILFITRMIPVFPYNLQNFAYGITDIKFSRYSLFTLLFMIPGVVLFTFGSSAIFAADHRVVYLIVAVIILVLVTAVSLLLYQKYFKQPLKED